MQLRANLDGQPLEYKSWADWRAEAVRRFGPDPANWEFICRDRPQIEAIEDRTGATGFLREQPLQLSYFDEIIDPKELDYVALSDHARWLLGGEADAGKREQDQVGGGAEPPGA